MSRTRDFIDGYRLARLIRVGQMCEVWEVIKAQTEERFAMKILRPEQKGNRAESAALKNEFQIAGKLKHPNIIRIFEYKDGDLPYLIMEVFAYKNLKLLIREGGHERLFHRVPKIVGQAIAAVTHLHTEGFIHRDIKPDNFLVGEDLGGKVEGTLKHDSVARSEPRDKGKPGIKIEDSVKLIDFAISKRQASGIGAVLGSLFNFGKNLQGTRSYMSPEQIRGQTLDPQSDIYSFGCVLFELVSGRPPFTGDTPDDLLQRHLHAPVPSPQVYCQNISVEFSDLIRRMIAKKKSDRPETMSEVRRVFSQIRHFKVLPKEPEEPPQRKYGGPT